jgi:hypothetical protein
MTLFIPLRAQPVLNATSLAPFGSSYNYSGLLTFNSIDTTLQGANQFWDFSSLMPDTSISTRTIFDPSQTIYASAFPTSNYGILHLPNAYYEFYSVDSVKMDLVGTVVPPGNNTVYSDPETYFIFPFQYGLSHVDSAYAPVFPQPYLYAFDCIGWGTLKVPGHTYANVLMRRVTQSTPGGVTYTVYEWFDAANGMEVFSYTPHFPGTTGEKGKFLYNISSSAEPHFRNEIFKINNPVLDFLHLQIPENILSICFYELTDISGRKVLAGSFENSSKEISIDFGKNTPGLYLLSLFNSAKGIPETIRIIKIN